MARRFNGTVITALVAGFLGGMLAPVLLPQGARSARPLAKRAVRAGLVLYDRGRERVMELGETASDLVAEVRAEQEDAARPAPRPAPDAAPMPGAALAEGDAGQGRRFDA